jgi:acyl-ACP thioesterase
MICDPANPKSSGIINVWQETFPVRFGTIDRSDRLTLDAMFQFFQEAAICHAENLGVGRKDMARTGQAWILSRITVIVDRRPEYCETITVRSWPRGSEKLFAMRNYDIRDNSDIPVVKARSGWIVVDLEKRRPLRPLSVMNNLPLNEGLESIPPEDCGVSGLAERSILQKKTERKALYTDIDYFGHVNNVRYVQWIEDALDPQILEKADKMRLDINYLNEILPGEIIEIYSGQIDEENTSSKNAYFFALEGCKKETGQAAFRAELRLFNNL